MSDRQGRTPGVHVVVPVKGGARAKSRLTPPPGVSRAELALALAQDTLCAVVRTPGVRLTVVSSDPAIVAFVAGLGADCAPDPGVGLNAAIESGLRTLTRRWKQSERVAVLLGDLPCLVPADLVAAFGAADHHVRAFVPDLEGTGTVLLTGRSPQLSVRFGPGSAAAHARDAARLDLDLPRLRRDIDVAADLALACGLGLGSHTAAVLAAGSIGVDIGA